MSGGNKERALIYPKRALFWGGHKWEEEGQRERIGAVNMVKIFYIYYENRE
jgi:hypothetical protein